MPQITIPLGGVDRDFLSQLDYALSFASEDIQTYRIDEKKSTVEVEVPKAEAVEDVTRKVQELVQRYEKREFGLLKKVHFEQQRDLPKIDAWQGLVDRRCITPVVQGHVMLRGPAAQLAGLIDTKLDRLVVAHFNAEREIYPSTILCQTL